MGLAPLLFAAGRCCPTPVDVLAGGRTGDELFWTKLFQGVCEKVHVTTDDGSLGICGTCVDFPEPVGASTIKRLCVFRAFSKSCSTWYIGSFINLQTRRVVFQAVIHPPPRTSSFRAGH